MPSYNTEDKYMHYFCFVTPCFVYHYFNVDRYHYFNVDQGPKVHLHLRFVDSRKYPLE